MTAAGDAGSCPRCGARVERAQEYCLDCGARLPNPGLAGAVGAAWHRRVRRRLPPWVGPIVAALLIAAATTGLAILISRGDDERVAFFEATGPNTVAAPTTDTAPPEPSTTKETRGARTTTASKPRERPGLVEWPPTQNGYTVVIASIPASGGRALALRRAREAIRSNVPDVGVVDSGEFSSLHPGYYVVFSGIYRSQRGAVAAVPRVQRLYPAAYIRQITR